MKLLNIATDRRANLIGSLLMVAAMALFAVEDTFLKAASEMMPLGQILILFGCGGTCLFVCLAMRKSETILSRDVLARPMLTKAFFEVIGRLFYVLALALIPLSEVTVILQATPLVVIAGAALVFGENVGWRRWTAIIVGFVGVMIILQPGTTSFSELSVLAVIGMLGFAGRDLASRAAPATLSPSVLGIYGFAAVIVAGIIFSLWQGSAFVLPNLAGWLVIVGAVVGGVAAYTCLMMAMRTGEVSAVTPFRYSRLLFGIAFGVLLFGETLSVTMLVGSGIIVISGLFILSRSKRIDIQN